MKKYTLIHFLLCLQLYVEAQDSTKKQWKFDYSFSLYQKWQSYSTEGRVRMPDHIRRIRKNSTFLPGSLPVSFDTITDNPFRHGATYISLSTQTGYKNKAVLFADVYAEHRGVSYGLFDRENIIIYPVVRLEVADTLHIGKLPVLLKGNFGQFLNERLDEGLMIYNIDVQGFHAEASVKDWTLRYTLYGDLSNGIGLDIDDLEVFTIEKTFRNKKDHAGISWIIAKPPNYPFHDFYSLSIFGRKTFNHTSVYFQYGYRPVTDFPFLEKKFYKQSAVVAGIEYKKQNKRSEFSVRAELRYYGESFNLFYSDNSARYRKPATDIYTMYANTIGKYLYPLRKYETPFNQWAVFTEYPGFDIGGLSLNGRYCYSLSEKIGLGIDYDINYIAGKKGERWDVEPGDTRTTSFIYPFFEAALEYRLLPGIKGSFTLGNKAMNLDIHYPTHYLLSKPCVGLSLMANFE